MTPAEFDFIAQYLKQKSGLVLTPDKQYLLDSRLTPVARRFNLPDLTALILKLRSGGDETVSKAVVEAMTTNESFFFRDKTPFEQFERMMLPALMKARAGQKLLPRHFRSTGGAVQAPDPTAGFDLIGIDRQKRVERAHRFLELT